MHGSASRKEGSPASSPGAPRPRPGAAAIPLAVVGGRAAPAEGLGVSGGSAASTGARAAALRA
eukprot:4980671-Lingulodinium_polyedra.AAC.1